MGLRYPIPLGGIFNQILGLFCMILSIWFQMPKAWRMVASFKKRVKWMIVFHLTGVAISALYWVLWVVMAYVPADYQPIMAVVIPLFREALVETLKSIGMLLSSKFESPTIFSFQRAALREKWSPLLSSRSSGSQRFHRKKQLSTNYSFSGWAFHLSIPRPLPLRRSWLTCYSANNLPAPW